MKPRHEDKTSIFRIITGLMIAKFTDWFTLNDYFRARRLGTEGIVRKYTHGNVALQNGMGMSTDELRSLSAEADKAMIDLEAADTK